MAKIGAVDGRAYVPSYSGTFTEELEKVEDYVKNCLAKADSYWVLRGKGKFKDSCNELLDQIKNVRRLLDDACSDLSGSWGEIGRVLREYNTAVTEFNTKLDAVVRGGFTLPTLSSPATFIVPPGGKIAEIKEGVLAKNVLLANVVTHTKSSGEIVEVLKKTEEAIGNAKNDEATAAASTSITEWEKKKHETFVTIYGKELDVAEEDRKTVEKCVDGFEDLQDELEALTGTETDIVSTLEGKKKEVARIFEKLSNLFANKDRNPILQSKYLKWVKECAEGLGASGETTLRSAETSLGSLSSDADWAQCNVDYGEFLLSHGSYYKFIKYLLERKNRVEADNSNLEDMKSTVRGRKKKKIQAKIKINDQYITELGKEIEAIETAVLKGFEIIEKAYTSSKDDLKRDGKHFYNPFNRERSEAGDKLKSKIFNFLFNNKYNVSYKNNYFRGIHGDVPTSPNELYEIYKNAQKATKRSVIKKHIIIAVASIAGATLLAGAGHHIAQAIKDHLQTTVDGGSNSSQIQSPTENETFEKIDFNFSGEQLKDIKSNLVNSNIILSSTEINGVKEIAYAEDGCYLYLISSDNKIIEIKSATTKEDLQVLDNGQYTAKDLVDVVIAGVNSRSAKRNLIGINTQYPELAGSVLAHIDEKDVDLYAYVDNTHSRKGDSGSVDIVAFGDSNAYVFEDVVSYKTSEGFTIGSQAELLTSINNDLANKSTDFSGTIDYNFSAPSSSMASASIKDTVDDLIALMPEEADQIDNALGR